jgi:hypothetical protein
VPLVSLWLSFGASGCVIYTTVSTISNCIWFTL